MMKAKSTKRALLMSALALLCCVSMFVGTTFAWFTDSVTSGKNTIQSGNLDVELYYAETANGPWDKVTATTDVFGYADWEPGHTRVAYFKVVNEGSLALKYQLTADVYDEIHGKNKDGKDFWLSDFLYTKVVAAGATREEILASTDGVKLKNSIAMSERSLLEDEEEIIGLAIWMPTTVGNEANHDGTNVPKIDFGINLIATQFTKESDSFDEKYDENAVYADAYVANAADLAAAIAEGGTVALMEDIVLNDAPITVKEDTVIDLNGYTLSGISTSSTSSNLIKVPAKKTMTLKNGTVTFGATTPDTNWGGVGQPAFPGYANNTINVSGKLVLDGATVENVTAPGGASYAIDCYPGADLVINDGVVDGNGKTAIRMFANSATVPTSVTINGGTIVGSRAVWVQLPSSNSAVAPPTNLTVNGGKLISTGSASGDQLAIYSYSYGNSFADTNIALNGGTYFGDVVFGGGYKGDKENVVINEEACTFYGDVYRYTSAGSEDLVDGEDTGAVASSDADVSEAINDGATTIVLTDGNYIIPTAAQGKTLTFIGTGDTAVATKTGGSYEGCNYALDGSTATFENITITTDGNDFTGYARCNATYKNCVINNTFFLYGNSVFDNCTFNVTGNKYNIWTYGAPTATFNDCTFNCDGKAIYMDGNGNAGTKLTVTGCVFNDNGDDTVTGKAAIETGTTYGKTYELIVNDTTVNGFAVNPVGISTNTTLWANKNSMGTDKLNVVVDGVDVY